MEGFLPPTSILLRLFWGPFGLKVQHSLHLASPSAIWSIERKLYCSFSEIKVSSFLLSNCHGGCGKVGEEQFGSWRRERVGSNDEDIASPSVSHPSCLLCFETSALLHLLLSASGTYFYCQENFALDSLLQAQLGGRVYVCPGLIPSTQPHTRNRNQT